MKKRKLFIILSFLTVVIFFATSAICTQCGTSAEAPTLELKIKEGPDFSESDNMCYYQVDAIVTGTPDPEIEFSTDDNVNPLDTDRAEVGVDLDDSYTLIATATNDAGTATASITLLGECGAEVAEEPPAEEPPDEEPPDEEPPAEEPPAEEPAAEEPPAGPTTTSLDLATHISGSIVSETEIMPDFIVLGDNDDNRKINGILSFNISGLGGESIESARLNITAIWNTPGDASEIGPLVIEKCEIGGSLTLGDFSGGSTTFLTGFDTEGGLFAIDYSGAPLISAIQNEIADGAAYFQIRLAISGSSNMDGGADQIQFDFSNVDLTVVH